MSRAPADTTGRIGPNAVLQILVALDSREGEGASDRLLAAAGIEDPRGASDPSMVSTAAVRALHAALVRTVGLDRARRLVEEAGRRTAAYLLAHRIPAPFQRILGVLPRPLARRLLLAAIARHAWTFTGGAPLLVHSSRPLRLSIVPCPLCPSSDDPSPGTAGLGCTYYAATFESILRELIAPRLSIEPATSGVAGSHVCVLAESDAIERPD